MKRTLVLFAALITSTLQAQTFTAANVSIGSSIDVQVPVVKNNETSVGGICSTGPFSASAPIYSVVMTLDPLPAGYSRPKPGFLFLQKDNRNFAFATFRASTDATLPAFKTSRKTYPSVHYRDGFGEITISELNWADVADVVDTLANNPGLVNTFLANVTPLLTLTLIPVTTAEDANPDIIVLGLHQKGLGRLDTPAQWQETITFIEGTASQEQTLTVAGRSAKIKAGAANTIALTAVTVAPPTNVKQAQKDVSIVGPQQPAQNSIVIVDSPCYTVRVLPNATGDALSMLQVDGHVFAPWSNGHNFFRAEGRATKLIEDATGSTVNITGEIAHNWDFFKANKTGTDEQKRETKTDKMQPRLALGAIFTYDQAESVTTRTRSESLGIKGSLSLKNLASVMGLKLLAGEETRPTFTLEGHYGNNVAIDTTTTTGPKRIRTYDVQTSFKAKFRWSQTAFSRIDASAAWSEEKKFGGRDSFAYASIDLLRIIVKNPMEFSVTYTCGRQPPAYEDNCGFLTGFSIASNQ